MEKVERKRKTDSDLYDVEVVQPRPQGFSLFKGKALGMRLEVVDVDTTRKQLKIYFVGFSHESAPRRSLTWRRGEEY